MFLELAEQTAQRPPDKQSHKVPGMRKTEAGVMLVDLVLAAAGRAMTEAGLLHFQRFRQYPSGACGGATGQTQSELALYINNGKLYFLITFPSLFKGRGGFHFQL